MNVVIRADASVKIGSGHIMRCLTLAGLLRRSGARVSFICRDLPGNLCRLIEDKGYGVCLLPFSEPLQFGNGDVQVKLTGKAAGWEEDAEHAGAYLEKIGRVDWLIVDHYSLDARWEYRMRYYAVNIMVIDDLADRPHDCDLLLDQNLCKNMETRYKGLIPENCRKLLGPGYALLRTEFVKARKFLRYRDGTVRRILIFFGGSDSSNETSKALEAIRMLNRPDIAVDVVVGMTNPNREQVRRLCSAIPGASYHFQVDNMAELMARADLAVGAGGTATWERCFLGLPAVVLVVAQNQYETTSAAAETGVLWSLGWSREVSPEHLLEAIGRALKSPTALMEMGRKAAGLIESGCCDGDGAVLRAMLEVSPWM